MVTAAMVCLAAAGCAAVKSVVNGAASARAPQPAATASGTSGPGLNLAGAPAMSGLASGTGKVVPPNPLGPPADPFAGTPADHWANGAAGIVLPSAAALGPYSKAQVQYAFQTTRQLLIAAYLDKQTLLGGAPTAFASLLTSKQRAQFLNGLNTAGLDKQGLPLSTRTWLLSFPPGDAQLIGSVIKVHGSMHAKAFKDSSGNDQLHVYLDYLFVYPVEPPHRAADWTRVVDEAQGEVDFASWQGVATPFAPWVVWGGRISGADCGTPDGYQHPAYPVQVETGPSATPTGTAIDPYAMGQTDSGLCNPSTGT
jgi:hypothetical protein